MLDAGRGLAVVLEARGVARAARHGHDGDAEAEGVEVRRGVQELVVEREARVLLGPEAKGRRGFRRGVARGVLRDDAEQPEERVEPPVLLRAELRRAHERNLILKRRTGNQASY